MGGLRVHVRAGGADDAPPVALVHGIGVSSRYLVPVGRELARTHRVLAPDLPGYGRSESPPRALGVGGLAGALSAWLDAEGLDRVSLLANSMGCQVVVDLALREPERVSALVLVGPTVDPHARDPLRQAARLVLDSAREPPSLVGIILWDYAVFGPLRFAATAVSALRDAIEEKLPHVRAPVLVVRGERDAIVPQRWAEEVTALLPRGRLVVLPGAAHNVTYDAPLELVRVVRPFLEEATTGRPETPAP